MAEARPTVQWSATAYATDGTATVTLGSHQAGDLLLAEVCQWAATSLTAVAAPSGWTEDTNRQYVTTVRSYQLFYRVATSSSETNPVFTETGTGTTYITASVLCVRGAKTTDTPPIYDYNEYHTSSTTVTFEVTGAADVDNCLALASFGSAGTVWGLAGTGWTQTGGVTIGNAVCTWYYYDSDIDAGATSAQWTTTKANAYIYSTYHFLIRPAEPQAAGVGTISVGATCAGTIESATEYAAGVLTASVGATASGTLKLSGAAVGSISVGATALSNLKASGAAIGSVAVGATSSAVLKLQGAAVGSVSTGATVLAGTTLTTSAGANISIGATVSAEISGTTTAAAEGNISIGATAVQTLKAAGYVDAVTSVGATLDTRLTTYATLAGSLGVGATASVDVGGYLTTSITATIGCGAVVLIPSSLNVNKRAKGRSVLSAALSATCNGV